MDNPEVVLAQSQQFTDPMGDKRPTGPFHHTHDTEYADVPLDEHQSMDGMSSYPSDNGNGGSTIDPRRRRVYCCCCLAVVIICCNGALFYFFT